MIAKHKIEITIVRLNISKHRVDKETGLRCDQTIMLTGFYIGKHYPDTLRRVKFRDARTGKTLVFLTNNFTLPALAIAQLYRSRWQVELFFKWITQHLRIKRFYGNSENAVKTQVSDNISTLRDEAYAIYKHAAIEFLREAYAESLGRCLGVIGWRSRVV